MNSPSIERIVKFCRDNCRMRSLLALAALGLLLAWGCTQVIGQVEGEIASCMDKCSSLCELAKDGNFSMGGFNYITLTKQSGSAKLSCTCQCAG